MNKHWLFTAFLLALLLAGCAGTEPTPAAPVAGVPGADQEAGPATLGEEYTDAASLRNQLALGTLRLEGTPQAITPEQAGSLLPAWQTLKALGESTTAAVEEMEAVQNQIVASLSDDQVAAIAALQLTNADLQAYYAEIGLAVQTPEPGVTPQSGALKELPQEDREAARATAEALGTPVGAGRSSGASKSDLLLDKVIELLTQRAAGA